MERGVKTESRFIKGDIMANIPVDVWIIIGSFALGWLVAEIIRG